MKHAIVAAVLALTAAPASAHDFWLLPEDFKADTSEPVDVDFMVGHEDDLSHWGLLDERILAFTHHAPAGETDIRSTITTQTTEFEGGARVSFDTPGTHMIAFTSRRSSIELDADVFNDYADKEGLAEVIAAREAAGTMEEPGSELYARRAKALIMVGGETAGVVTEPIGQTLEIVPLKNPYALEENETLPVQVLFRGKPLEGATLDLENLTSTEFSLQTQITDAEGMAEFDLVQQGAWKLNVIWGVPMPSGTAADFDTVFSSLTFGYE